MKVKSITIRKFKAIDKVRLDLKAINLLAGGNNAGKSCALQAIHVAVALAQTARVEGAANFAPEKLRYVPTDLFTDLKHREQLSERGDPVSMTFEIDADPEPIEFRVPLYRGRNSTIKTVAPRSLETGLGAALASSDRPFSVYVPGLAGIPSRETYQGKLVVDRGAVRGDANLYLRNVLYRLFQDPIKKEKFRNRLDKLFDGLELFADEFDELRHEYIPVWYRKDRVKRPLDMIGTGALQAIQILGYASYYQPVLLLLDEPDAHLHPNNQLKLADVLALLAAEEGLQVVLATHSRHLLQAIHGAADVASFHLKAGALVGSDPDLTELLVDLGAVDEFESLTLRDIDLLVLAEDGQAESDENHPLRMILRANGCDMDRCKIISFSGCTELRSVSLLSMFIATHHPRVSIIVHRDADFLTAAEIRDLITPQFENLVNTNVFVTDGSDLESYFTSPEHVADVCLIEVERAEEIINEVATEHHNALLTRFNDKRAALHKIFGKRRAHLERTEDIRSREIPLPPSQRVGKDMIRYLEARLRIEGYLLAGGALIKPSGELASPQLAAILPR